jgi:hypothetical protein
MMPAYDERFSPPAPIAEASLRNPESGASLSNMRMLIDSGADVSVLPESAVESLGITLADKGYEIMSFDGTVATHRAARADLVFMRKTFKGQFLVIDQEVGVLGRDILNHLALVLDGPRRNWEAK